MMKEKEPVIQKAIRFAIQAHAGQVRKGDGRPYEAHLIGVAILLARQNAPDYVIAAGLLHDTLEDTETKYDDLAREFGVQVADLVKELSEDKKLPWKERKEMTAERVETMQKGSLIIKTADKIDNLRSFCHAYREQGPALLKNFKAPLGQQIKMSRKLYKALYAREKKEVGKSGVSHNVFLPDLEHAIMELEQIQQIETKKA